MSTFESAEGVSLIAGAAFAEDDFGKLLEVSGDHEVSLVNAVTDTVAGVLGSAPVAAGEVVNVVLLKGIIKVRCSGAVTPGQIAVPAANGGVTGVADINALGANVMGVGIFIEGGADGEIVSMLAQPLTSAASA